MNGFDVVLNHAHFFTHGSKFSFVIEGSLRQLNYLLSVLPTGVDDYQMPSSDNLTPKIKECSLHIVL